jgi:hypothetical protein
VPAPNPPCTKYFLLMAIVDDIVVFSVGITIEAGWSGPPTSFLAPAFGMGKEGGPHTSFSYNSTIGRSVFKK